jgi:hypothetical protein
MVEVWMNTLLIAFGFILVVGLMIEARIRLNEVENEFVERLELMERALEVVGGVLSQIPEMVPQFSINQNPLSQILEFFQTMKAPEDASYTSAQLRDDTGKYSHGSGKEESHTPPPI